MRGFVPFVIGCALLFSALCLRPVRIASEDRSDVAWLWAWQSAEIHFINSVTHRPVTLRFGLPWRFSKFAAETDGETESYYTGGTYSWNERLGVEHTRSLHLCSEVGMSLRLGHSRYEVHHGCVQADLLWPPG